MKKLFLLLAIVSGLSLSAQSITNQELINVTGKQRMLSQKMAKAYLLKVLKLNTTSVKKDLTHSKIIFQHNMELIEENIFKYSRVGVKAKLEEQKDAWRGFKQLLTLPPNKSHAKQVIKGADILLSKSNAVVQHLNDTGIKDSFLKVIDDSGRQRMLSQKICLYYLSVQVSGKSSYKNNLESTFKLIDDTNKKLMISKHNTNETESALIEAMVLFEEIRDNRDRFFKGGLDNDGIFKLTNNLTKQYNLLTSEYSKLK